GADLFAFNTTGIAGGNLALNCIAIGEDGAIYAANEVNANTAPLFTVYRWPHADATTAPTVIYSNNFAATYRWGDTLAVRGSGTGTQLLTDGQNGTVSA